jgi:Ca2+-binding EF-hand superfamily protein
MAAVKKRTNTTDYEDQEVWKECFDVFDRDRDGKLTMDELAMFIRALSKPD